MTPRKVIVLVLALLVAAVMIGGVVYFKGCGSAANNAVKEQMLSKEDSPQGAEGRRPPLEEIDLAKLPGDVGELEKVLFMSQEDVQRRLKSFVAEIAVSYDVDRKVGAANLQETHKLEQAANGAYWLVTTSGGKNVHELYYADGRCYDRGNDGGFRGDSTQGKGLFWREKVSNNLSRFYSYFRGHLTFSGPENASVEGRKALKFTISLDPSGKTPQEDLGAHFNYPNQYAISAMASERMINETRKRISRFEEAKGFLLVDAETKALMGYEFSGRYALPVSSRKAEQLKLKTMVAEDNTLTLTFKSECHLKRIGQDISIPKPGAGVATPSRPTLPGDVKELLPPGAKVNEPTGAEAAKKAKAKDEDKNGQGEE